MHERLPIGIGPEFDSLVGQQIRLDSLCRALGVTPVLSSRETVTWMQFNQDTGTGINAWLSTYEPEEEMEPFDCTLAVYESSAVPSGKGVDSHCVATMDFVKDEDDPSLLRVVTAEAPESLQEASVMAVLREIRYILQDWPMQREQRG